MSSNLLDVFPFLSDGFCSQCKSLLQSRLQSLQQNQNHNHPPAPAPAPAVGETATDISISNSNSNGGHGHEPDDFWSPVTGKTSSSSPTTYQKTTPLDVNHNFAKLLSLNDPTRNGTQSPSPSMDPFGLSPSEEHSRMLQVGRTKNFNCAERVNGKSLNILQGLELHTRVFDQHEQATIVDFVYNLQKKGQSGKLRDRTYSEPRKWMRGKGRVTMQFGCCYNYAVDKNGNPPGIIRDEDVDPIPSLFKSMIKRMVRWRVLPSTCIPNSCIVNIYDEGDCIPPHIDHHDFVRPFCTVSFLTESKILFGSNLKVLDAGEFSGPAAIPLPVGSVLVLKGNGADIAKHCVPAVLEKRISITFRKMDDSKLPFNFLLDPELKNIQPLGNTPVSKFSIQQTSQVQNLQQQQRHSPANSNDGRKSGNGHLQFGEMDFPPLGAPPIATKSSNPRKN